MQPKWLLTTLLVLYVLFSFTEPNISYAQTSTRDDKPTIVSFEVLDSPKIELSASEGETASETFKIKTRKVMSDGSEIIEFETIVFTLSNTEGFGPDATKTCSGDLNAQSGNTRLYRGEVNWDYNSGWAYLNYATETVHDVVGWPFVWFTTDSPEVFNPTSGAVVTGYTQGNFALINPPYGEVKHRINWTLNGSTGACTAYGQII